VAVNRQAPDMASDISSSNPRDISPEKGSQASSIRRRTNSYDSPPSPQWEQDPSWVPPPTWKPTSEPSWSPTEKPSWSPTWAPTWSPTWAPTWTPTWTPTETPTYRESDTPSWVPTQALNRESDFPSWSPTQYPSEKADDSLPAWDPTWAPSWSPTAVKGGVASGPPQLGLPTPAPTALAPTTAPTSIPEEDGSRPELGEGPAPAVPFPLPEFSSASSGRCGGPESRSVLMSTMSLLIVGLVAFST
jgi:hypothetical protein